MPDESTETDEAVAIDDAINADDAINTDDVVNIAHLFADEAVDTDEVINTDEAVVTDDVGPIFQRRIWHLYKTEEYIELFTAEKLVELVFEYNFKYRDLKDTDKYWWTRKNPKIYEEVKNRDSGKRTINISSKDTELSCRFCPSTNGLNVHHIWAYEGPRIPKTLFEDYYKHINEKLEEFYSSDDEIFKKLTSPIGVTIDEIECPYWYLFFHYTVIPKGPTEMWNLVYVCKKHHPPVNSFTFIDHPQEKLGYNCPEGSATAIEQEECVENFFLVDGYLDYLNKLQFDLNKINPYSAKSRIDELIKEYNFPEPSPLFSDALVPEAVRQKQYDEILINPWAFWEKAGSPKGWKPKGVPGYCIICRKKIKLDPDQIYICCKDCWESKKSDDVKGEFCFHCGEKYNSTLDDPICKDCEDKKK
jgi:hypothetical protein